MKTLGKGKVGSTFELKGKSYKVSVSKRVDPCTDCSFLDKEECLQMCCSCYERTDDKMVIYKEVQ